MKNRVFSGPLFVENLKRFWPIAAVGFVFAFLCAPFEMLRSVALGHDYSFYTIRELLVNHNIGFVFLECVLPAVAAVTVFAYLNKINSVSVIHAQPYSRSKLFFSNYISGLFLAMLPMLLIWILLIVLKRPVCVTDDISTNIYTFGALCKLLLDMFTIELFTYSLCVFACIISGNGVIAALTAIAVNGIVPVVMLICYGFIANSFYGFVEIPKFEKWMLSTHPVFNLFNEQFFGYGAKFSYVYKIAYIAIALAIAVLSCYFYYARKLERCGEAYVFSWTQHVVGFIFVFVPASACGLVLFEGVSYWSYVIGGLIGFLLGQLISRKTFKILNKKTLKNLLIYGLLMALIICVFSFDLFGIEDRVLNADDIESVGIWCSGSSRTGTVNISDEDNIENAVKLHQSIVDNKEKYKEANFYPGFTLELSFNSKGGEQMMRRYYLPSEDMVENKYLMSILQSEEYNFDALNLKYIDVSKAEFFAEEEMIAHVYEGVSNHYEALKNLSDQQKRELLAAITKDTLAQNDLNVFKSPSIMTIRMNCKMKFESQKAAELYFEDFYGFHGASPANWESQGDEYVGSFYFSVKTDFVNTIDWLKKNGCENVLGLPADGSARLVITKTPDDFDEKVGHVYDSYVDISKYYSSDELLNSAEGFYCISDPEQIERMVLTTARGNMSNYSSTLWGTLFCGNPDYYNYTFWVDARNIPTDIKADMQKYGF